MEKKPLISVIMPVYNVEDYVGRAIESIQNQNFSSYEIICVDDCSTDNSYGVLESYALKNSKIKLHKNDVNMGAGASKNRALDLAAGEYICFCDADDYFSNDMFEKLYEYIARSDTDGVMYGSDYWIGNRCNGCKFVKGLAPEKGYSPYKILECHIDEKAFFTSACRMMVKLSYLRRMEIRFSERTLCDDLGYTLGLMLSNEGNFIYLKDSFYNYCRREGSISSNVSSGKFLCGIMDVIFSYVETKGNLPKNLQDLLYCILANLYMALSVEERNVFFKHINDKYGSEVIDDIVSVHCSRFFKHIDMVFNELKQHNGEIYIYGAGNYAIDLYRVLKTYDMCVSGFVVSSLDGNPVTIDGIQVLKLSDNAYKISDCIMLVATHPKHHDNIARILGEFNINNVVLCK